MKAEKAEVAFLSTEEMRLPPAHLPAAMSERFSRRSIVLGRRGSSYTGLQGPATPSHFPSHLINAEPAKLIAEINTQVATFRDLLIHVGHQSKDGPEMRERIRKLRRQCVEAFKHSVQLILPQIRRKAGKKQISFSARCEFTFCPGTEAEKQPTSLFA
ncbi:Hypothetical predicted protein [Cloeon dipterum]|uniref:Syntaxin N-terminal domain-containing protein n=1 Tax=Cloeon dipterum TaxID=197152 RepID=A0A8S1DU86_9INSE|nr:Hypothetical predicted protein [Cloeon dipterum]